MRFMFNRKKRVWRRRRSNDVIQSGDANSQTVKMALFPSSKEHKKGSSCRKKGSAS